jgi:hypothetical protein
VRWYWPRDGTGAEPVTAGGGRAVSVRLRAALLGMECG